MRFLFIISLICFTAAAFCEDAAPVVTAAPTAVDATAKWVGYIWAGLTAGGLLLTGVAAAIRAFLPTSNFATAIDAIAHIASAVGTSVRPSQYVPPKQ